MTLDEYLRNKLLFLVIRKYFLRDSRLIEKMGLRDVSMREMLPKISKKV